MTTPRPRIAYLLKKFPRLSETFVLNEILAQEAHGTPLVILSRRQPDDEPRHPELARLKAVPEYLPPSREVDAWAELFGPSGEFDEEHMRRVARAASELREYGHPRFPVLLSEALLVLRRCREMGIAHIHVHFATDAAVVAHLVRELGGPTYSITMHAKDVYRKTVNARLLARMVKGSEFVVTVCDANVRFLEELIGDEAASRIRRLYNGIDIASFEAGDAERETGHIVSVGRMIEKKGYGILVEALRLLRDQGREFRATLVGDGDLKQEIDDAIEAAGLRDRVDLLGAMDQDEVRHLLRRGSLFALTCVIGSDGNRDALPTVLLEAQASGLPIVSTPVTGIPEILDDGKAGLLVPCHDPAATADALGRMLDDADLRKELAAAGRRRVEQLFDLDKNSATLARWFAEVAEGVAASPAPTT